MPRIRRRMDTIIMMETDTMREVATAEAMDAACSCAARGRAISNVMERPYHNMIFSVKLLCIEKYGKIRIDY